MIGYIFAVALTALTFTGGANPKPVVKPCQSSSESVTMTDHKIGMGNAGYTIHVTNNGPATCSVDGYPALALTDKSGIRVDSATTDGSTYFHADPGKHLIVLAPGSTVRAWIGWFSNGQGSRSTYLHVRTPGSSDSVRVKLPGAPLTIYGGALAVTALTRTMKFLQR